MEKIYNKLPPGEKSWLSFYENCVKDIPHLNVLSEVIVVYNYESTLHRLAEEKSRYIINIHFMKSRAFDELYKTLSP